MDRINALVRKDMGEIIPLPCKKDNHLQMRKRDLFPTILTPDHTDTLISDIQPQKCEK